jgi:hypothetical protein
LKLKMNFCKLVVATSAALVYSSGFAADVVHPPLGPHLPMTYEPSPAPVPPKHGPYSFASHGMAAHNAVQAHAKMSCEHLAHHFVGTVSHAAFYNECMNTHMAVMTHIVPHPAAAGGAPAKK